MSVVKLVNLLNRERAREDAAEAASRARLGRERSAFYGARGRRPFASRGAGVRPEMCVHCINEGVDEETSYLLHSDPELKVPVTPPQDAEPAEADRLMRLGYSRKTAQYAAAPYGGGEAVR